jgi:hypothetical protein
MLRSASCFLGLFLVSLSGCAQLMPASMTNLTAARADNPLGGGAPLHWAKASEGLPFEGERACSTWPIEDELTVTAADDQICVKGHVHKVIGSEFGAQEGHSIQVQSDGSGDSGFIAGNTNGIKAGRSRKIGQCIDHGAAKSVWEEPYDGCVPNKDAEGKPALTKQSTFLQVGSARWKFDPAPAPAPAAQAAPKP